MKMEQTSILTTFTFLILSRIPTSGNQIHDHRVYSRTLESVHHDGLYNINCTAIYIHFFLFFRPVIRHLIQIEKRKLINLDQEVFQ